MLPILGLLFVMLALPVGLMVWGFAPRKPSADPADAAGGPDPLRAALERSADSALQPAPLAEAAAELTLRVADVGRSAKNLAALATELGGSALVEERSTSEIRVLASLPIGTGAEFSRRAALATGIPVDLPEGAGVVGLTLVPSAKP